MQPDQREGARYQKDVPTLDADDPWHRIHARVRPDDTVLDIGCGSGDLGALLARTAAAVDGIEPNPERAEVARTQLRAVVTGEGGPVADVSLPGPYDVIVFADVLEHIAEPGSVLAWAISKLSPGGRILALIPNSANWKFRRQILHGDWSYDVTGYFDNGHVRFYDTSTARELGPSAGLRETHLDYVPGELPKPLRHWSKGAAFFTARRPNLFAGHVLVEWQQARQEPPAP